MELDIRHIAEEVITELLSEAERLKQQAEGARKLFVRIVQEGEKANGSGQESTESGIQTPAKE